MLRFNLARDTYHQQQWLAGIEQLRDDGLAATGFEDSRADEENPQHDHTFWDLSEGSESSQGRWARGPRLDGRGRDGDAQFRHLSGAETAPIGGDTNEHLVPPDPNLFVTYDGAFGPPKPGNAGGAGPGRGEPGLEGQDRADLGPGGRGGAPGAPVLRQQGREQRPQAPAACGPCRAGARARPSPLGEGHVGRHVGVDVDEGGGHAPFVGRRAETLTRERRRIGRRAG